MKTERAFRITGFLLFFMLGYRLGEKYFIRYSVATQGFAASWPVWTIPVVAGLILGIIGYLIMPAITLNPLRKLSAKFNDVSMSYLITGSFGLMAGLIASALLAVPLSKLPDIFGEFCPILATCALCYLGIVICISKHDEVLQLLNRLSNGKLNAGRTSASPEKIVLLDTSVIIDGRIADIAKTGFLPGSLIIPRFILQELQYIADSEDALRRQRGRRGLEILAQLQKEPDAEVKINDFEVNGVKDVDAKLVVLARQLNCPILTNDYNLNRVADLQGVRILNVNDLANAVKSVLLPGEHLRINVIQEGKEQNQGVGYMEDGTMVVIENGRCYVNHEINAEVTKVLQTAAGRMIFARHEKDLGVKR